GDRPSARGERVETIEALGLPGLGVLPIPMGQRLPGELGQEISCTASLPARPFLDGYQNVFRNVQRGAHASDASTRAQPVVTERLNRGEIWLLELPGPWGESPSI